MLNFDMEPWFKDLFSDLLAGWTKEGAEWSVDGLRASISGL